MVSNKYVIGVIVYLALIIAFGYGWVMNIVHLIGLNFDDNTGMFVARCIGIVVAPLGAILGYC